MAFTVQTDDGLPDGNAYISHTELIAYWDDRGTDLSATPQEDLEAAIVRGTQSLDARYNFVGWRLTREQVTEWPRSGAWDRDGYLVDGIPQLIKNATAEMAKRELDGTTIPDLTFSTQAAGTITAQRVKAGPVEKETEYSSSQTSTTASTIPLYPVVDRILRGSGLVLRGTSTVRA